MKDSKDILTSGCSMSTLLTEGSLPPPCGRALHALPHLAPDALSASFDTGMWGCPIVSTADHASDHALPLRTGSASDLPALLQTNRSPMPQTRRARFGSDAPVQSETANLASRFALENCVFARSGTAQSAPPLLGGRGSKVISRVTRKSLGRFPDNLVTTLPLRGAPVWRSASGASETRAAEPASLPLVTVGQTGIASLWVAPDGRSPTART